MAMKSGLWEIYQDHAGEYRFRLKSRNGEIVLQSEGYTDKPGANDGIDAIELPIIESAMGSGALAFARVPRVEIEL